MPSGKTHDKITQFGTPVTAIALGVATADPWVAAVTAVGFSFGGFMLSPDLDIYSLPYKRWGPLRFIWLPYRKLCGRHRSPLSHAPVIGTLGRLFWLTALFVIPLIVASAIAQRFLFPDLSLLLPHTRLLGFWVLSVELSALSHIIPDHLVSEHKQRHRRNRH